MLQNIGHKKENLGMYLISIYFDKRTEKRLQKMIDQVAWITGNSFMIDHRVPPHITVAEVETRDEELLISHIGAVVNKLEEGNIKWVSFLLY